MVVIVVIIVPHSSIPCEPKVRFRFRVDLQTGVGPPIGPKVVPFWDYLIEF